MHEIILKLNEIHYNYPFISLIMSSMFGSGLVLFFYWIVLRIKFHFYKKSIKKLNK